MQVKVVSLSQGRADVSVIGPDGRDCFGLLVEHVGDKMIVHYTAYESRGTGRVEFEIPPARRVTILNAAEITLAASHRDVLGPNRNYIEAIKQVRNRTGLSLVESKKVVDDYRATIGNP